VDGNDGSLTYGEEGKKVQLGAFLKDLGDAVGFCMHF